MSTPTPTPDADALALLTPIQRELVEWLDSPQCIHWNSAASDARIVADTFHQLARTLATLRDTEAENARLKQELQQEREARNRIARECANKNDRSVDYGRLQHAEDEVESAENALKLDAGISLDGLTVADGIREVLTQLTAAQAQIAALAGTLYSYIIDGDSEDEDATCRWCEGCGEVTSQIGTTGERDELGCALCAQRERSRLARKALAAPLRSTEPHGQ